MAGVLFLSLKRQFYARRSRGTKIRRKKKKEKRKRERKREREGEKKRKISLTWSRVMSMNFYIEMLSRCYREEKIKTRRDSATIMTYVRDFLLSFCLSFQRANIFSKKKK